MYPFDPGNLLLGLGPWWTSAVAEGLGLRCLLITSVGVVGLSVLMRALWAMARSPAAGQTNAGRSRLAAAWGRVRGESGTATVEFVLVFPLALTICLILLQTVFLFTGNLFVNYAAFAAARSAIVQIPDGRVGGGGELAYGGDAYESIRRSAAFAVAPVSGELDPSGSDAVEFVTGLQTYFGGADDAPAWVDRLAGQRLAYALRHTRLVFYETRVADNGVPRFDLVSRDADGNGGAAFGPKDPVTVGVEHDFALSIPYASFVFADQTQDAAGNTVSREHTTLDGQTPYTTITAQCTMTLEGYDRNLPPLPAVEREN